MGYFDTVVFQKLTANPFTITFSNFTPSIDSYVKITIEEINICGSGLYYGFPGQLYLDTNKTPFKNLDNTTNSKVIVIPLVSTDDVYTTYKYLGNQSSPLDSFNLPAGTTSVTFTIKRTDSDATVPIGDYQYMWIRLRLQGL